MRLDKTKKDWWQKAVFYQIYPKSFQDTDNDGVGDLAGVISRLDYLEKLGIDGIWLSPVFCSPQVDNGYDISDYRLIDPGFGTMEQMDQLIRQAKQRDISVIMDLVLNHCSDQHFWFQEALKGRDNPYHDYFVWRDGTPDEMPNDMCSVFGGPAWTYVPALGQYYFHQFAPEQPDLNWDNPKLRQELYEIIRYWVAKGVEGFRLDVIDQVAKVPETKTTANGPMLHVYLQELSREAFQEPGLVTVGETWSATVDSAKQFSRLDGRELSMVFQFEHICLDQQPGKPKWDVRPLPLPELKSCIDRWQRGLYGNGWNSLFLNNHDLPRIVSRWGDDKQYRVESAKMLATMLHGLQGTPYIYQGEELGMTNICLPLERYRDIEIHNLYAERIAQGYAPQEIMQSIYARGRDNARTPMQWTDEVNAGFSKADPWLPVNPNYVRINAHAALQDTSSVFYYYQELIALRKQLPVFQKGRFTLYDPENEQTFFYSRDTENEHLLVLCNFSDRPAALPNEQIPSQARLLMCNYKAVREELQPYEARMYYWTKGF